MESAEPPVPDRRPRTERGRRTLRRLLDAAAVEFGEKGFHDASISGITARAGMALGSFYTYFESKDAIFRALVTDLSGQVRNAAAKALAAERPGIGMERAAFRAFLDFARSNKEIYRIIDEAEFADPESYSAHYRTTAVRIAERLRRGGESGALRPGLDEAHAWAIMGMNVFLGLRYAVWDEDRSVDEIVDIAGDILANGIVRPPW